MDVEFVVIDWDNKVMELDSKKIDVVWNGMTLTDEMCIRDRVKVQYLPSCKILLSFW